jgi:hypothetical protein
LAKLEDEPSQVNLCALNWTFGLLPRMPSSGMLRAKVPIAVPSFGAML